VLGIKEGEGGEGEGKWDFHSITCFLHLNSELARTESAEEGKGGGERRKEKGGSPTRRSLD